MPTSAWVLTMIGGATATPATPPPKLVLPENVRIVKLPPYSPELNPVEQIWDLTRERYFANHVFDSLDEVEATLTDALLDLNDDPMTLNTLTGRDWILNSIPA